MSRTVAESIDQRQKNEQTSWVGVVIGVDYVARQIAVNVRGGSGPRRVRLAQSIDLGTATNPKVIVGGSILIQRIEDEYIAIAVIG